MTGGEVYKRDLLYVLNKIQEKLLWHDTQKPGNQTLINYRIETPRMIDDFSPTEYKAVNQKIINHEIPAPDTEQFLISKLASLGILKIFLEPEDASDFKRRGYPGNSYIIYKDYGLVVDKGKFKLFFDKNVKSEKQKIIENVEMPSGTKWNDIEIKFKNPFDVEIYRCGELFRKTNNVKLGFFKGSTKDKVADEDWEFLRWLADVYLVAKQRKEDKIPTTTDDIAQALGIKKDAVSKRKESLSKRLQSLFDISDDPFKDYKRLEYYQTEFTLTGETDLRTDKLHASGKRYYDDKFHGKNFSATEDKEDFESLENMRDAEIDFADDSDEAAM